ncbi:MAG: hypothetical protein M3Y86_12030 [Verrucomicrobiota bacterium]|nr:hypothetical protein [Verrucomicrobiota bacterium]
MKSFSLLLILLLGAGCAAEDAKKPGSAAAKSKQGTEKVDRDFVLRGGFR